METCFCVYAQFLWCQFLDRCFVHTHPAFSEGETAFFAHLVCTKECGILRCGNVVQVCSHLQLFPWTYWMSIWQLPGSNNPDYCLDGRWFVVYNSLFFHLRSQLTAMHYKENTTAAGQLRWHIKFPRYKKTECTVRQKKSLTYTFIISMDYENFYMEFCHF